MVRVAAVVAAFVIAFAGVVAAPGPATAWEYGDTAFEVHLMGAGETGFYIKWWPAPAADPITVTFEDPATPTTPDYQTEFVPEFMGDEGYGGGSGVPYEAKPGDVVAMTDGMTTKSHTVLAVRVTSVDVAADRVHGTAAPNSEGYVWSEVGRDFTADATGKWMVDFSVAGPGETPLDIVAGTQLSAEQFDADGDSTVVDWEVPRPDGWQRNPANGHDYLYVEEDLSWTGAEAYAVSLGGHLVTISSAGEDAWLTTTLGTGYGIGLNDRAVEGVWKWASGEPVTYTHWLPGEPNNVGTGEDAVVTWNRPPIGWIDVPGFNSFVVEKVRAVPFTDIVGSIFKPDIEWVYLVGITSGCTATKYCPDGQVTREQMASFLARALHLSGAAPDAFTDDETSAHEPNINLVAKAGIASGCAPGRFCPAGLVSREQMASFLARALKLSGSAPDAFTDDETSIHEPNINLVAKAGIASGCGVGRYCPKDNVTRGQMAAFLHRAFGE